MKKLITVAIVTVVGFFALNASARMGVLQVVNFKLVYQPQGGYFSTASTSGSVTTIVNQYEKEKGVRVTSKDILKLIATVFETNFPSGSQLAFDGGEFAIVDSTGQNVIFYPNSATPPVSSDWEFSIEMDEGVQSGKGVSNSLGDEKDNYTMCSIFHIYLRNNPNVEDLTAASIDTSTDTFDLTFGGLITQNYTFKYDHSKSALTEKGKCKMTGAGDGFIGDQFGILTGSAKGHGSFHVIVP